MTVLDEDLRPISPSPHGLRQDFSDDLFVEHPRTIKQVRSNAPAPGERGSCACASRRHQCRLWPPNRGNRPSRTVYLSIAIKERALSDNGLHYTAEQGERLREIHSKLLTARRELDALIGDAYLRPRASIVPVHFLDLASAVEKLRWAEKEWRELDDEVPSKGSGAGPAPEGGSDSLPAAVNSR